MAIFVVIPGSHRGRALARAPGCARRRAYSPKPALNLGDPTSGDPCSQCTSVQICHNQRMHTQRHQFGRTVISSIIGGRAGSLIATVSLTAVSLTAVTTSVADASASAGWTGPVPAPGAKGMLESSGTGVGWTPAPLAVPSPGRGADTAPVAQASVTPAVVAIGEGNNSTAIAYEGAGHRLWFLWQTYGTSHWNPEKVAGLNTAYSAPSIGETGNSATVIAVEGPHHSLLFWWQTYGARNRSRSRSPGRAQRTRHPRSA